ncbi:MAG: copper-binding protein [Candidatus Levybacteria bacterium CG_4_10_14_0_2_um_filter_35_8]|nr:MAG: copper-binding protein [Candidatus Levybacteria bacterium CG22_combo_CG10-13_8_21_14_all_35_11]PJA00316.1 MAG: copper-binding protein [Candidatus Levybacteria bacterium CG_4_10_14_0_2_um_filter_35_8]PJC54337.1 MAG: copper-binding protein [Candidatus Levybacteria bacterium CG_4_9_14_0_2_um_filter_35_21]
MDKVIVTIIGAFGIVFTYWFFLFKKEKEIKANGSIDIIVDGGYSPSLISLEVNKKIIINFLRKDSNSCLEEVIFPDFKIKRYLPLNKRVTIELNPSKKGEYSFRCGMNMFHGKVIVK